MIRLSKDLLDLFDVDLEAFDFPLFEFLLEVIVNPKDYLLHICGFLLFQYILFNILHKPAEESENLIGLLQLMLFVNDLLNLGLKFLRIMILATGQPCLELLEDNLKIKLVVLLGTHCNVLKPFKKDLCFLWM